MLKSFEQFPESIKSIINNQPYTTDAMGLSSSSIYLFESMVLKIDRIHSESMRESGILAFLQGKTPVPKIILDITDDDYHYLLMEKIHGTILCDDVYLKNPLVLVDCLVDGLKTLWKIPIEDCPFDESIATKLEHAKSNILNGLVETEYWDPAFNDFETPEALYTFLFRHQPIEDRVFSHGDFCLPNILYDGRKLKGFIDLGRAGISSKWQDISLAVRSLQYNLETDQYTSLFFQKLGIEEDKTRLRYYMLLDELF